MPSRRREEIREAGWGSWLGGSADQRGPSWLGDMSGHSCSQWPRYLWSGFGFPFFLMLLAVVSLKCNRPSVTLVTWAVRKSILKQTTEMSRECNRAQRLGSSGLLEPSEGFVPCSHHPAEAAYPGVSYLGRNPQQGCTKEGHRTTPC